VDTPVDKAAFLLISFGGPERHEDVLPFLENVLRGRNVPRERMLEVAEHYYHFDGRSPINDQNRELLEELRAEFAENGPKLPLYWGNRNWHPMLQDTLRQMRADGISKAIALATSAFGSYSGCRQYCEDIDRTRAAVGADGQGEAPRILKIRPFSREAKFIDACADRLSDALRTLPEARLVFTAHSIPMSMANTSPYLAELKDASAAVAGRVGKSEWDLVYQSRSGPPGQPWLEPDIGDHLRRLHAEGVREVAIMPIGFLSDHMEVLYDLDTEAAALCSELGMKMVRARTVETHPVFVSLVRDLVAAALEHPPAACAADCCPPPARPVRPAPGS